MESSRGIKPVCPALAGKFLTAGPPGKPHSCTVMHWILQDIDLQNIDIPELDIQGSLFWQKFQKVMLNF